MAANPCVEARRQWDERYADLVLGGRNWQIAAGGLLAATLASPYPVVAGSWIPTVLSSGINSALRWTDPRPGKPECIRQRDWQVHPHSPGKPLHRHLSERVDLRAAPRTDRVAAAHLSEHREDESAADAGHRSEWVCGLRRSGQQPLPGNVRKRGADEPHQRRPDGRADDSVPRRQNLWTTGLLPAQQVGEGAR